MSRLIVRHFREYDFQVVETKSCLASIRRSPSICDHQCIPAVRQRELSMQMKTPAAFLSYDQLHNLPRLLSSGGVELPATAGITADIRRVVACQPGPAPLPFS